MNTDSKKLNNEDQMQKLKDFSILKDIIEGRNKIENLDNETKVRIISLCGERQRQIEKKTEIIKNKNIKLKLHLNNMRKKQNS